MKHFLVTDDQGNAIYIDPYFKERSHMLCLPFGTTQDIMLVCEPTPPLPPRSFPLPLPLFPF